MAGRAEAPQPQIGFEIAAISVRCSAFWVARQQAAGEIIHVTIKFALEVKLLRG